MLPPVSLPMEKPTSPAAVAAPGPALDPDAPSSSSHGFMVWPPNQMSLSASAPEAQLGDQHGARIVETLHDRGILGGHAVAIRLGAVGGGDAGGVEQVLPAPGDAVERAAVVSGGDLTVGLLRLPEGQVACERDDAAQLGIEALQPVEIDLGEARRRRADAFRSTGRGGRAERTRYPRRLREAGPA